MEFKLERPFHEDRAFKDVIHDKKTIAVFARYPG